MTKGESRELCKFIIFVKVKNSYAKKYWRVYEGYLNPNLRKVTSVIIKNNYKGVWGSY